MASATRPLGPRPGHLPINTNNPPNPPPRAPAGPRGPASFPPGPAQCPRRPGRGRRHRKSPGCSRGSAAGPAPLGARRRPCQAPAPRGPGERRGSHVPVPQKPRLRGAQGRAGAEPRRPRHPPAPSPPRGPGRSAGPGQGRPRGPGAEAEAGAGPGGAAPRPGHKAAPRSPPHLQHGAPRAFANHRPLSGACVTAQASRCRPAPPPPPFPPARRRLVPAVRLLHSPGPAAARAARASASTPPAGACGDCAAPGSPAARARPAATAHGRLENPTGAHAAPPAPHAALAPRPHESEPVIGQRAR